MSFANYFPRVYQPDVGSNMNYPPEMHEEIDFPLISVDDALQALQSLRHNSVVGFDGIFPTIVKGLANIVLLFLCHIFNRRS